MMLRVVPITWNLAGRLYRVTTSNAVCRRPCVLKKIFRVDPDGGSNASAMKRGCAVSRT
jgi:hypothetical protein